MVAFLFTSAWKLADISKAKASEFLQSAGKFLPDYTVSLAGRLS
jgi:hypothetical protein